MANLDNIKVSKNLIGFKLLVTETLTIDLLTQKSIGIIYGSWTTKTLFMVSLSLIGFNLLSRQGFYVQDNCDLDFRPTDPKINRVHLWVMAIHVTKNGLPRLKVPFGHIKMCAFCFMIQSRLENLINNYSSLALFPVIRLSWNSLLTEPSLLNRQQKSFHHNKKISFIQRKKAYRFLEVSQLVSGQTKDSLCWLLETRDPLVSGVVHKIHLQKGTNTF